MKLFFSVKSLGKREFLLESIPIELDISKNTSLREFLKVLVKHQVKAYNIKKSKDNLLEFLTNDNINSSLINGSVKFNEQYNRTPADELKAIQSVLQAYEDGLIVLFINEERQEILNEPIGINESDSISIIRLSFLSGSIW